MRTIVVQEQIRLKDTESTRVKFYMYYFHTNMIFLKSKQNLKKNQICYLDLVRYVETYKPATDQKSWTSLPAEYWEYPHN